MGESTRRSVRTAVDLRDAIAAAMTDATTRALNAGPTEAVDLGGPINSVMLAIDEYADHLRDMWAHNPPPPAPALVHVTGPALVYVHTDGQTFTAVDHAPVRSNPRERAISRALITEALRHLEDTP